MDKKLCSTEGEKKKKKKVTDLDCHEREYYFCSEANYFLNFNFPPCDEKHARGKSECVTLMKRLGMALRYYTVTANG